MVHKEFLLNHLLILANQSRENGCSYPAESNRLPTDYEGERGVFKISGCSNL